MSHDDKAPRAESALPTISERLNMALSLLYPDADDLDTAVADQVSATSPATVTASHIAALRAGDVNAVPAEVVDAVVGSIQLSRELLFGDDPEIILPAWASLQALRELQSTTPRLVQLRSGAELSPQAREDLLRLLNPRNRNGRPGQ